MGGKKAYFPFLFLAWIVVAVAIVHALWVVYSAPNWPVAVGYALVVNVGVLFVGLFLFVLAVVIACFCDPSSSGVCSSDCIAEKAGRLHVPVPRGLLVAQQSEGKTVFDVVKDINCVGLQLIAALSFYPLLCLVFDPVSVLSSRWKVFLMTRVGFSFGYFLFSYLFLVSVSILLMKVLAKIATSTCGVAK